MRHQDLILVAKQCLVSTRFRNTLGLSGHLAVRLQPHRRRARHRRLSFETGQGSALPPA